MPTYDYHCDACGYDLEMYQPITEDAKKKCPKCSKNKLRRLIGAGAAIVFKGSGFYKTDYRSESYKKAAAADKSASSSDSGSKSSDSGSKSTGESKGPAKAEPKSRSSDKS